jgi:hypothetical protein
VLLFNSSTIHNPFMACDPARYQHHHKRVMQLVDASLEAYAANHSLKKETGYYDGGWRNPDTRIVKLEERNARLSRIIDRASQRRERYCSAERWTPYRAWPY